MRVAMLGLVLSVLASSVTTVEGACSDANWWKSFDKTGLSKCDNSGYFITGFYRNDRKSKDYLYLLEEARCCSRPSPWRYSSYLVLHADWWKILDSNNRWGKCPDGYFLNGIYRNENNPGWLHNIEEGRCVKAADAPSSYSTCYNHNIGTCFDNKGWCTCNSGYYVTGVYRGGCDSLYCMETLRCCKPPTSKETLDELFKVKNYVMDITLRNMALLAHYMGYGWCAGCRSGWVGDDFARDGDKWVADKSMRCSGYKSNHRLSLAFGDWSFSTKRVYYGTAVVDELQPESVDDGVLYNNDATEATKSVSRSEISVRSVTHTTTSSWKTSHELGIEITYTPPELTGGVGGSVSYTFGYESGTTTEDSTQNQQTKTFTVSSSKTLEPHTSVRWQLVMTKTRSTLPYTAKVLARFSTEFQGFLRWGGGGNNPNTNYHASWRGSGDRPTVNYKFGDASVPFYTALYRESSTGQRPWLWHDLKSNHGGVQGIINQLTNENKYTITLTGRFEDVLGKQVQFTWGPTESAKKRSVTERDTDGSGHKTITTVAKAGPNDPLAPNPDPPSVDEPENNQTTTSEQPQVEASGGSEG